MPRRSTTIRYINPTVPQVALPAYSGVRYTSEIADTLDLQEMASLGINGLAGPTDPEADYEIYWRAAFHTNPPVVWHSESDIVQAKFMEALPLLRLASGSREDLHVEQRWMEVMLQMQGPDGLIYLPKEGRPWCVFGNYGVGPPGDHYFSPWFEGRILGAMTLYGLLTGDERWRDAGRRLVDGLAGLLQVQGNKAHFHNHEYGTGGRFNLPKKDSDRVHNMATYLAWCIQGLANFARHTGHERALVMAGQLARYAMEDCHHFGPEGQFLEEYPGVGHVHFHGHTMALLGILDYGLAAGDRGAVEFAHRGFRYGMSQGECRLGFFAEWLNVPRPQTLEVCELADMLAIALKLSEAGVGDYWDMADRWTRNLFFESQLHPRHVPWLKWLSERSPTTEIAPSTLPPHHTADRAIERNLGAFGGWLAPNDWMPDYPHDCQWRSPGIMHCCTGNAERTIYYLWQKCIGFDEGTLRVNLLFNHASEWADVQSHLPCTGEVSVRAKKNLDVAIRLPEWAGAEQASGSVNGVQRPVRAEGRWVRAGRVSAGDTVTLTFPVPDRMERIHVEKRTYRIRLRGSTCLAIDPPGRNVPLFRRDQDYGPAKRWRKAERFVPERVVVW